MAARKTAYKLDDQVGFVLRQAQQRHATLFASLMIEGLTPTQWAALAKLAEVGASSQNRLGRLTAMDAATIKGVIDRLVARGFVSARADADDARRLLVDLTPLGAEVFARAAPVAHEITTQRWRRSRRRSNERSWLCCGGSLERAPQERA